MNYNDIIEYIDDTFDENFEDAKHWCRDNSAELVELIERRTYKEVEEEVVEADGNVKIVKVQKLFRYFQIKKLGED